MKLWLPVLVCITILAIGTGCNKKSSNPIPYIEFKALSPDSIRSNPFDTAYLAFHFSDGDGDLGNDVTKGLYDVFLRDLRDSNFDTMRYIFPPIPDGAIDPIDGISGTGVIAILGNTLSPRQDSIHYKQDTVVFEMWIKD
ncbi:MAG: hypothetical protein ABI378_03020, partial [Chitinophagaceae bacterium]